jgi:hypothetical protein
MSSKRLAFEWIADDDAAFGRNLVHGFSTDKGGHMMASLKQARNQPRAQITGRAGDKEAAGRDGRHVVERWSDGLAIPTASHGRPKIIDSTGLKTCQFLVNLR